MITSQLIAVLHQFRAIQAQLTLYKFHIFKPGAFVRVQDLTDGIVGHGDNCPADKVPVTLGNGNTWWYDVENVTVIPAREARWEIRRLRLDRAGIKTTKHVYRKKAIP